MSEITMLGTSYTYENRAVLWVRFTTVPDAREGIRDLLKYLAWHGYSFGVWSWGAHPPSGEFEVLLLSSEHCDVDRIVHLLYHPQPPCSNRGVTGRTDELK